MEFHFKRCVCLFVLMASLSLFRPAQAGGPYDSSDAAKSAMDSALQSNDSANSCMTGAHRDNDRNNDNISKVWQKVAEIVKERDQTLHELRAGLYCDKCWRTKSEIEKGGEGFYQHLQNVKGNAVAAPPEKIVEKEKEYQDKIDNEKERVKDYQQTFQGILKQWTDCHNQSNQAIYDYNEAANAARILEWQEAQAKRQQEYEEWHRKTMELLEEKQRQRDLEIEKAKAEAEQKRQDEIDAYTRQLEQNQQAMDRLKQAIQTINGLFTTSPANPQEQEAEPVLPCTDITSNSQLAADLGVSNSYGNNRDLFDKADDALNQGTKAWNEINGIEQKAGTFSRFLDDPAGVIKEQLQEQIKDQMSDMAKEVFKTTVTDPAINHFIDTNFGPNDNPQEQQFTRAAIRELPVWEHFSNLIKNGIPTPFSRQYFERLKTDLENIKHYPENRIRDLINLLDRFGRGENANDSTDANTEAQ